MPTSTAEGVFHGVWRGQVVKTDKDEPPSKWVGKVKVKIPDVYGENVASDKLPWAYPIFPLPGSSDEATGLFGVPPLDSYVFVMFERGDPQSPLWIGGCFQEGRIPAPFRRAGRSTYPSIYGWALADGMMLRMVEGGTLELLAGRTGERDPETGRWVDDNEHGQYDTSIKLDKRGRKIEIRSKGNIDFKSEGRISFRSRELVFNIQPPMTVDPEGNPQATEGATPQISFMLFDPTAGNSVTIRAIDGSLKANARKVRGFKDS